MSTVAVAPPTFVAWTPGSAEAQALSAVHSALNGQQQGPPFRAGATRRSPVLPSALTTASSHVPRSGSRGGGRPRSTGSTGSVGARHGRRSRHAHTTGIIGIEREAFPLPPAGSAVQESIAGPSLSSIGSPPSIVQDDNKLFLDLQEENRRLREEITRQRSESIGYMMRRPLAAIAGGGFRGHQAQKGDDPPIARICVCDQLRAKLARVKAELLEARASILPESRDSSKSATVCDMEHAEVQTMVDQHVEVDEWQAFCVRSSRASASQITPMTTRWDFCAQATPGWSECRRVAVDAAVQAQEFVHRKDAAAQASPPPMPRPRVAAVSLQTEAWASYVDSAMQTALEHVNAETQTVDKARLQREFGAQTEFEAPRMVSTAAQANAPTAGAAVQTSPLPTQADAETQAAFPPPPLPDPPLTKACSVQTAPPSAIAAASQTEPPKPPARSSVLTQTAQAPRRGTTDRWTQIEDTSEAVRIAKLQKKLAEAEAASVQFLGKEASLCDEARALRGKLEQLQTQLRASEDRAATLQQAVQNKAFRQLNVTILCPRAECTVNGDRVEMDSWDPARLKSEFEAQVLPRFARVFVEEADEHACSNDIEGRRNEAAGKAIQEFAEVFRERLSAMLSAPNAAEAYAMASKGRRSIRGPTVSPYP